MDQIKKMKTIMDFVYRVLKIKRRLQLSRGVAHWHNEKYLIYTDNDVIELSKRDEDFIKLNEHTQG